MITFHLLRIWSHGPCWSRGCGSQRRGQREGCICQKIEKQQSAKEQPSGRQCGVRACSYAVCHCRHALGERSTMPADEAHSAQRHFETAVDCSYTWANDLFFTIVLLGCRLPINVVVDLPILLANSWFSLRFYHGIYLLFNPRCLTELVLVLFSGSVWLLWWMNHGRRSLHLVCCNSSWRTWRPRRSTYDFCLLFQLDLVINLVSNLINPCNNPFQCSPNLFSLCVS